MNTLPAIHYTLCPRTPCNHIFELTCTVTNPALNGQCFYLPAWIPGSYMIRDFSRNIIEIKAEAGGKPIKIEKQDKHSWLTAPIPKNTPLTLHYRVYAWDLSVRGAHLDTTHGFFNGCSVFLAVEGQENRPCTVDINAPADAVFHNWQVITALPPADKKSNAAPPYSFGRYQAENYDELIDHPVEMGRFTLIHFNACETPHDIALTGLHDCDATRLSADLTRICTWQIQLFGTPPPMDYYAFLVQVVGSGYGGLEHRASTALLASRYDLPYKKMTEPSEGYIRFLGLCSHEYFHTWNVKRIKPAAFTPYDLKRENYTTLLWAFEGFTSYYDDLTLVRTGIITPERYLELLGKTISSVLRGSGRLKQSVAESSFDAWIKYYRQDENTPNAVVSYYTKGALIALALDLQLRTASHGTKSLDDLMRMLWEHYGKKDLGVAENDIFKMVETLGNSIETDPTAGNRLARWLKKTVNGKNDLPLAKYLKPFGILCESDIASSPALGIKISSLQGEARIANIDDDGPAQAAGLAAGDVLVAINGLKVNAEKLDTQLERYSPTDTLEIHFFRHDELHITQLTLVPPQARTLQLKLMHNIDRKTRLLRSGWLGHKKN